MVSVKTMQTQLSGMVNIKDLTEWENEFVKSISSRSSLSDKQLEIVERIWKKHFAG